MVGVAKIMSGRLISSREGYLWLVPKSSRKHWSQSFPICTAGEESFSKHTLSWKCCSDSFLTVEYKFVTPWFVGEMLSTFLFEAATCKPISASTRLLPVPAGPVIMVGMLPSFVRAEWLLLSVFLIVKIGGVVQKLVVVWVLVEKKKVTFFPNC